MRKGCLFPMWVLFKISSLLTQCMKYDVQVGLNCNLQLKPKTETLEFGGGALLLFDTSLGCFKPMLQICVCMCAWGWAANMLFLLY